MKNPLVFENVGDTYKSYRALKILEIEELRSVLVEAVHEPTGAELMFILNDDEENLFNISFSTRPTDSKGTAHILEHIVLCGSENYPVRDPFFAMTRRSLNTFMNAFTGSDFTCYPAASQVEKDFYNLLDVYLDAVFRPTISRFSFLQEGHRLEFADPKDPKTPLVYKGIVFNEMKGSMASADSRVWHAISEELLPDTLYAYNSGGEPKDIPSLSYEELLEFHKEYYHPSRALFFFYGNLPIAKHLDFLEENLLSKTERIPPLPPLPLQKRFTKPKERKIHFPASEQEDKAICAFGWLTGTNQDQEEVLSIALLDSILMDTDASPLRKKLLASGLCVHANSALDIQLNDIPYIFFFRGCKEKDFSALQSFFEKALKEIIEEGIPPDLIDSSLHQLEFSRSEIGGDHYPFGLTLFFRAALAKQHGCLPENSLVIHALFEKLLEKTKDPDFLPGLIKKYLLQNPHRVYLLALPDPLLTSCEEEEEKAVLKKKEKTLTEVEKEQIVREAEELVTLQETEEDLDCLPRIAIADVTKEVHDYPLRQKKECGLTVFHHENFTNSIVYVDVPFSLPHLAECHLPALQFFTYIFSEVGVGEQNFEEILHYHHAHLGHIGANISLHQQIEDPTQYKPALHLKARALTRKSKELFTLLKEMATSVRLDEKARITQLLMQKYTALENRLNHSAIHYAKALALSSFSLHHHIHNESSGLPYFTFLRKISREPHKIENLMQEMISFSGKLFASPEKTIILSSDDEAFTELHKNSFYGLSDLPITEVQPWKGDYSLPQRRSQFRIIASPVSFTAAAVQVPNYLDDDAPALSIAAELFSNLTLHPEIREKGGAYGSGSSYHSGPGLFTFYTYRDPHIARSAEVFFRAIDRIASGKFNQRELEEAKLGIIQNLDSPVPPCSRAIASYNYYRAGKTLSMQQRFRDNLLSCTQEQVASAVAKHLSAHKEDLVLVSFANKELLEREHKKLPDPWKELPILSI